MKILVLGAGRMGLGASFDLAHNSEVENVTVADVDLERARAVVQTVKSDRLTPAHIDVTQPSEVVELMRGHDTAISCVVYHHNPALARAAVEARVNFCDLGGNNSIVAEELALDDEARSAGINIIPDCGLAPGMVSVLVAQGAARFQTLEEVHIRVGGLPQNPKPPLNYQIVFAVEGLINEYVERARVIRDGRIVEIDSMTELERLAFPSPYGEMEAFQSSGGTSTLPETFAGRVRELDYKTIRYPGHCEKFKLLIDLGLASSSEEIDIKGVRIAPRRVLGEMLTRRLPADEPDLVFIRVEFRGRLRTLEDSLTQQLVDVGQISKEEAETDTFRNVIGRAAGQPQSHGEQGTLRYDIIDKFDEQTGLSAMMRTTAFPASIIAQMMARGDIKERGAIPQERCVPPGAFVAALAARNINIEEKFIAE
jgi:lysine 6-dehydrogenase